MLGSADCRELRDCKQYQTSIERTMSDHGSTEEDATGIPSKTVEAEVPEILMLTQKPDKLEGLSLH